MYSFLIESFPVRADYFSRSDRLVELNSMRAQYREKGNHLCCPQMSQWASDIKRVSEPWTDSFVQQSNPLCEYERDRLICNRPTAYEHDGL